MTTIFEIGTLWFWLLTGAIFMIVLFFVENEEKYSWFGATLSFVVFLALVGWLGNGTTFKTTFQYIRDYPLSIIGFFIVYVISGVAWSFVKWYIFLKGIAKLIHKYGLNGYHNDYHYLKIPEFKENKERIISWITYWPFSIFWTLTHTFFFEIYNWITNTLEKTYQRTIDTIFEDIKIAEKEKQNKK